jgi:hypothetical protein
MGECRAIAELPNLRNIVIAPVQLKSLAQSGEVLPHLERASVANHIPLSKRQVGYLVKALPRLRVLTLTEDATDFAPLAELPRLRSIEISKPSDLVNVPPHIEVTAPPAPRY